MRKFSNWRFSANRLFLVGGIWPILIHKAPAIQSVTRHLFAEGAARQAQAFHDLRQPATGFDKSSLNERTFERLYLLRERTLLEKRLRHVGHECATQSECVALSCITQFSDVSRPLM